MSRYFSLLIVLLLLGGRSFATDLVIDRIVITRHPIPPPYYVFVPARAGRSEATFHESRTFGHGGIATRPVDIRLNMVLSDVQLDTWATVSLHLDHNASKVTSHAALRRHRARIHILRGTHRTTFTPQLHDNPFIYELFYHTRR